MQGYPVIVVGTGRSGTSHVARLCQSLNIHMGDRFADPDETNPEGFMEDLDIHNPMANCAHGEISKEQLVIELKEVSVSREKRGIPWGFKEPMVAGFVTEVQAAFPGARWLQTCRNMRSVVESMQRCYDWSVDKAERVCRDRLKALMDVPSVKKLRINWIDITGGTARKTIAKWLGIHWAPRVLATTCNLGWVHRTLMKTVSHLTSDPRVAVDFDWPEDGTYCIKMNQMARAVVREGYDFWFNMDDDNGPVRNPVDLIELDLPVIGLVTPIWKQHQEWPFTYSAFDKMGENSYRMHDPRKGGLQKVDAVGSGCMLVRADVLRAVGLPAFVRVLSPDGCKAVQGPDMYFSDRVVEAGFDIHAHYDHKCNHVKDLDLGTMFEKCFKAFHMQKDAELVTQDGSA